MRENEFFETVIRPTTKEIGLIRISRDARFDGRPCIVTHTISKIIFTDFDRKLSGYLAACSGKGFPGTSVGTKIRNVETGAEWSPFPTRFTSTVLNAMETATRLALGESTTARVRVGPWRCDEGHAGEEQVIDAETLALLATAISALNLIGPSEFLEVSGNYRRALVRPDGSDIDMLTIDLNNGTLTVPDGLGTGNSAWTGPIFGFERAARQIPAVASYLGHVQHSVTTAKEQAILAFRDAAEARIQGFDSALDGRPLAGYRLDAAKSLVARLQLGLGSSLLGLSEVAQITAFDWAEQMRAERPSRAELVQ